jgi:hypothetical protein
MLAQRATRGTGARMSGAQHGAGRDDSKGFAPGPSASEPAPERATGRRFAPGRSASGPLHPTVLALRGALTIAGLAGAVLLVVASFTTIIEITVGTTARALHADTAQSGWDRHGPALILLGLLALWLLAVALRGSRVAMAGLALVGVASLAIAVSWDRPHLHDTGSVGEVYEQATADPGTGYYLETLGGALLLFCGGALLALGRVPVTVGPENADGRPRGGRRSEVG